MDIKIKKLVISVFLPLFAGFIGSYFTTPNIAGWYSTLIKPAFNPPNWVFGPVWTLLYIMMGLSFYLIWSKGFHKKATAVFLIQLALNSLWSILFFGLQNPFLAFVEIFFLWIAIVATIYFFYKIDKRAAYLMIPYILWVSFAAFLNYSVWILNI